MCKHILRQHAAEPGHYLDSISKICQSINRRVTSIIVLIAVDSRPHCSATGTPFISNISLETKQMGWMGKKAEIERIRYKDGALIDKHRKILVKENPTEEMFYV